MATAASCGRAFLIAGHRDRALRSGAFLVRALERQRQPQRGLDLSFDDDFQPIEAPDPSDRTYYRFDPSARGEKVWFPAFSSAFLCELYQVSRDEQYLRAAQAYFSWIERTPEFLDGTLANGKSGWAAGLLADATSDGRYWSILQTIVPNVLARQSEDGEFHESHSSDGSGAAIGRSPADVGRRLERTAEFTTWTAEFLRMFSARVPHE